MVFPIAKMIFTWKNLVTIINRKIDFFEKKHQFFVEKSEIDITNGKSTYFQHFLLVLIVFEKVSFPIGKCFFQNTHRYSFEIMKKFFILSMGKSNFFFSKIDKIRSAIYREIRFKTQKFQFFQSFLP